MAILKRLGGLDFRGMDVVEVAPAYDHAEITALAAPAWSGSTSPCNPEPMPSDDKPTAKGVAPGRSTHGP
jgi:hypothetical protein